MSRRRTAGGPNPVLPVVAMSSVMVVLAGLWLSVAAGAGAAGQPTPGNPFGVPVELVTGQRAWPGGWSTIVAAALGAVLVLGGVTAGVWRLRRPRGRVDAAASSMATPRELRGITGRDVRATARRLRPGVAMSSADEYGVLLGRTVPAQW